jgi:hypothetical protein
MLLVFDANVSGVGPATTNQIDVTATFPALSHRGAR